MGAPVLLCVRAAVEMPFVGQLKIIELTLHLARHGYFRVVIADIHVDARARGGRDLDQPAPDLRCIVLRGSQGMQTYCSKQLPVSESQAEGPACATRHPADGAVLSVR